MCQVDYADPPKLSRHETRRAAKDHKCDDCGRTIKKGEHYTYATGLEYGENFWWLIKQCAHCNAAAEWLVVACSGFLYAGVLEDLEEHWEEAWELRSPMLGRLILRMRRRWTKKNGELFPIPDKVAVAASVPAKARAA